MQDHRFECAVVALVEEVSLRFDDCHHRAGQCLVTLLDGVDEPLGAVDLRLDKLHGLLLGIGELVLTAGIILHHLLVVGAHVQVGYLAVQQLHDEFAVAVLHKEVGDDRCPVGVVVRTRPLGTGRGVEVLDLGDDIMHLILRQSVTRTYALKMPAAECLELLGQDLYGALVDGGRLALTELYKQTLLEVVCAYACGIELLDLLDDVQHLLMRHNQRLAERQVIFEFLRRAAQVTVLVDIAHHELRYVPFGFGHLRQIHLRLQVIDQR